MHTAQLVRKGDRVVPQRFRGLARLFFSAADPVRLQILGLLAGRGEACVSDLADELGMSVAAVSHHLQILRECRCLEAIRMGRMARYRFRPNSFTKLVLTFLKKPWTMRS